MKYWKYIVAGLFITSIFFVIQKETVKEEETRAVYFSYIEFSKYITDKDEETSKRNIIEILDNLKNNNFNRIIVHVRAFSNSIFKSNIYPESKYVMNNKGLYPNYDILDFFIKESHKRNIFFDAWINPYRVSNTNETDNILYDKYKNTDIVNKTENGIYFNPARDETREIIISGIKEIVENYDVDGIHFDDYFYPDKKIDLNSYDEYTKSGGSLSIDEYRKSNVLKLIKEVNSTIKNVNKKVIFGIAPQGNIDNCYIDSFLDIKELLSSNTYLDYIMPQIYFGFNNETRPYIKTINEWASLIKDDRIKLIPALAFYKIGKYDKYALSGSYEWINNNDIIAREISYSRKTKYYDGFSLFSYNYLFNKDYNNTNIQEELTNLKTILKE